MIKRKVSNGYTTVTMYYDRALREMPYAQCGVNIHSDGTIDFISYTTRVITITPDGWHSAILIEISLVRFIRFDSRSLLSAKTLFKI